MKVKVLAIPFLGGDASGYRLRALHIHVHATPDPSVFQALIATLSQVISKSRGRQHGIYAQISAPSLYPNPPASCCCFRHL